jgi:predicted enzyme related to lactoylglutathione lyase
MVHEHEHHDHHHDDDDDDHDHEIGPRHFFGVLPVFLVDDIVQTVEFYRDVLGFEVDFLYGTPPAYASVSRDDAILNFSLSDPPGRRNSVASAGFGNGVDAYIVVSDVDDLYEELREHGAKIVAGLASHEYGMREFQIEDCNQYRIALAEETDDV